MVRKRAEGLCRRVKGLVKVLQAFKNEEVPGYRDLQVNTEKFGSGVSLSIKRGVVFCRNIILMKVDYFLKKGFEIKDVQGKSLNKLSTS